jgi:hypothetical protein
MAEYLYDTRLVSWVREKRRRARVRFNLRDLAGEVSRDPAWIARHYQWLSTKAWKRLFEADRIYVTPTLDTIAIVKRDSGSRGTMADPSALSDSRACVMSE